MPGKSQIGRARSSGYNIWDISLGRGLSLGLGLGLVKYQEAFTYYEQTKGETQTVLAFPNN